MSEANEQNEQNQRHARAYARIAENLVRCITKCRQGRLFFAGGWHRDAHETWLERLYDAPDDAVDRTRRTLDFFDNVGSLMQYGHSFSEAVAATASHEWRQLLVVGEQPEARDVPAEVADAPA